MLDTIRLEIHGLSRRSIRRISRHLETFTIVQNDTGFVSYELTRGHLLGSWDYRISIQPRNYRYTTRISDCSFTVGRHRIASEKKQVIRVNCPDFLVVEFSVPKFLYGVNFFNLSMLEAVDGLYSFRRFFTEKFSVSLPDFYHWLVVRADISVNFDFGNSSNISSFIDLFRNLNYPRRKRPTVWHDSLLFKGFSSTIKLYNKHAEFRLHDYERLKTLYDKNLAQRVYDLTSGIFRFEISYRKRKLQHLGIFKIDDFLTLDWWTIMKKEFFRVIDGAKTTRAFRHSEAVDILTSYCRSHRRLGITVEAALAIWSCIVLSGKQEASRLFGRQKVWRACRLFDRAGLSTLGLLSESKPALSLVETNIFASKVVGDNLRQRYLRCVGM